MLLLCGIFYGKGFFARIKPGLVALWSIAVAETNAANSGFH